MKLKTKIATGIVTFSAGIAAQAGEIVEQRGYDNCVEHIEQKLDRQSPKISPIFYLAETADALTFYINAAAWVDGDRQAMRSECVTSLQGHNVLSIQIEPGRFKEAPEGRVEIEVAAVD